MEFLLGLIAAGVLWLVVRDFWPGYAQKNRLTEEIERVRKLYAAQLRELEHQNSLLVEEAGGKHPLRMAAPEKRLEVHQRAFGLWRRLIAALHSGDIDAVVRECQQFWDANCLYLSAEARDAFNRAYLAAGMHRELTTGSVMGGSAKAVEENWQSIVKAGEAIVASVGLAPLGEREAEIAAAGEK